MITSTVVVHDRGNTINQLLDRKIVRALNAAAVAAANVANEKSGNVGDWAVVPAHGTFNGYESGIRADSPLWHVFDKGSLGKRTARLKQNRRKAEWRVVRRGANPYVAHRRDIQGKGVDARHISNPARTAGRKALKAALTT